MFDGTPQGAPDDLTQRDVAVDAGFVAKEAYTAAELAALKLPGLPGSEQKVNDRAKTDNWPAIEEKSRGRNGVTRKYPVVTLPPAVRIELQRRATLAALATAAPARPAADPAAAKVARALDAGNGKTRLDAHVAILSAYDAYCGRNRHMTPNQCEHAFPGLWSAGQIPADPAARAACPRLSNSSLRRWLAARTTGDLARLAGNYGNRKGTGLFDGPLKNIRDWALNTAARLPNLSAAQIRAAVAAEFGETVSLVDDDGVVTEVTLPSLRKFQTILKAWKDENPALNRRLNDPDGWKNRDMLALGDLDQQVSRPNQMWMIDASPADAHATDGRHNIYVLIDVYTRRIMALVTKTPRTEAVKLLLRRALLEWGVPECLVTDNGSDFVSREARRVFAALAIAHDPSTAFSPWEKGFVERVIGTVQHGLFPMLPGYCGHNVASAAKIRASKAFSERLGESDRAAFAVALSAADIGVAMEAWVRDVYHHQPHGGLAGKSPFQMLAEWQGSLRKISDVRALDMLLVAVSGVRLVRKKGLRANNRHYWDRNGALIPFVGSAEALEVRIDPADVTQAYIYQQDSGAFVCVAQCLEDLPAGELAAVAVEAKAKQRKAMAVQAKAVRQGPGAKNQAQVLQLVLRDAAARNGALAAAPKPAEEHSSPALEAGAAAAAAQAPARAADVIRMPGAKAPAAPSRQDDEERWWMRWREIDARINAGEAVTPAESQWRDVMQDKPFIKARRRFDGAGAVTA